MRMTDHNYSLQFTEKEKLYLSPELVWKYKKKSEKDYKRTDCQDMQKLDFFLWFEIV